MKKFKIIAWTTAFLLSGLLLFHYPPVFQRSKEIPPTDEVLHQAKITAPLEKSEFEKTASYGTLDCNNFRANIFASTILDLINNDRQSNLRKPLEWSPMLCMSAALKSEDMAVNNYFEHISPSGIEPWYWLKKTGYKYAVMGENLALNCFTAQNAHEALMGSPGHRANILNKDFTQVGFGYARGKINGEDAFILVQHFATPQPEKVEIKYLCEEEKAQNKLKEFKKTENQIEKYLAEAKNIHQEIKDAGQNTKEVDKYIDDMKEKEKEVTQYIKEIEDYLKQCKQ